MEGEDEQGMDKTSIGGGIEIGVETERRNIEEEWRQQTGEGGEQEVGLKL